MKLMVNGKEADLSRVLPLSIGDWVALEKLGASLDELKTGKATPLLEFVAYIAAKANPAMTRDEVASLPRAIVAKAGTSAIEAEVDTADRPTSDSSIGSQGPTGGVVTTSTS